MKLWLCLPLLILLASNLRAAEDKVDGFTARIYKNNHREKMPYRLFIPPGYDKSRKYPLIIWLHGAGGAGDDNLLQISGDQISGTRLWTKPENQMRHPAFVLVPQSAGGWASSNGTQVSTEERLVIEILNSLKSEFSIDSKRVYIAGQSNGGFGTWDMISKRPELFAAAIPLCGGGNPILASNLIFMPIWAFHGDQDDVIPVTQTRQMIAAIKNLGGVPRYTEYKGVDHDVWTPAFKEPGLVDWLFAQHR
jgi:predicted peptidase